MHSTHTALIAGLIGAGVAAQLNPGIKDPCVIQVSEGCRLGKPEVLDKLKELLSTQSNVAPGFYVTFWELRVNPPKKKAEMTSVCSGALVQRGGKAFLLTAAHCVVFPESQKLTISLGLDSWNEKESVTVASSGFQVPPAYTCCNASEDLAIAPDPFRLPPETLEKLPKLAVFNPRDHQSLDFLGRNASEMTVFERLPAKAWDEAKCADFWKLENGGEKGSGVCFTSHGKGDWSTATRGDSGSPAIFPSVLDRAPVIVGAMSLSTLYKRKGTPAHAVVAPMTQAALTWIDDCLDGNGCAATAIADHCLRCEGRKRYCAGEPLPKCTPPVQTGKPKSSP
jgi:hypothetical protein